MATTFTARTETTYEVLTNYGQTIRVVHEPSKKTATLYLENADGSVIGEIDFEVKTFNGVPNALSEMFAKIDGEQLDYEERNN